MIILHKNNYNPKLDFLICKNLLKETPRDCDELDFKDCFFGRRKPLHFHEKQIVKVKKFFKTHNILKLSRWDIRALYRIITGSKEKISFGIICPINSPDDIVILANLVRSTNSTRFLEYCLLKAIALRREKLSSHIAGCVRECLTVLSSVTTHRH